MDGRSGWRISKTTECEEFWGVVFFCIWVEFYKERAYVHFEISAMKDTELRRKCLNGLKEAGFKFSDAAFGPESKYTPFFGRSVKVSDMTDHEEVRKAVDNLLKTAKTEFTRAEQVFREVFQTPI